MPGIELALAQSRETHDEVARLLSRPAAFTRALENHPGPLERALAKHVDSGRTEEVADLLAVHATGGVVVLPELSARTARALGRPVEAARAILSLGGEEGAVARHATAATWALEGGDAALAAHALDGIARADYDDEVRAVCEQLAQVSVALAAQLFMRLAESPVAKDTDVGHALNAAQAQSDDFLAAEVGGWRVRQAPRDYRAWPLVSRGGILARTFFSRALAVEQRGDLEELNDREAGLIHGHREGSAQQATPELQSDPLWRARHFRGERKARAWRDLGEAATEQKRHVDAARLLARGGVSLQSAPIEVRLVADPALGTPRERASALAAALSNIADDKRAAPLKGALGELDARGYCGARHRVPLRANLAPVAAFADAVTRGEDVDPRALLDAPLNADARTTLAALFQSMGHEGLAMCLDARVAKRPSLGLSEIAERASAAAADGRALEAAGLLRLRISQTGVTPGAELQLREWARAAGRLELVAESLGREALVQTDEDRRVELLLERGALSLERLNRADDACRCAARAAKSGLRESDVGQLWIKAAERAADDDQLALALAFAEKSADGPARVGLVMRRAALLRRHGDPAAALVALDASLNAVPGSPELLAERAFALEALGENSAAAAAFVKAGGAQADKNRRFELRQRGAALFVELSDPDRAITALLRSAEEGDDGALVSAEEIARDAEAPALLEAVLALRLPRTDDAEIVRTLSLERARLLADHLNDRAGAIALLEQQAVDDERDIGARFALAEWYLADRRMLDAALAYESAASIEGIPDAARGPAAKEAAGLLSVIGDLDRAGPLADLAIRCGTVDDSVLSVARAHHQAREDFARVDELLELQLNLTDDNQAAAHVWMERARIRQQQLDDTMSARQALHRVLEFCPDHTEALDAMRVDADQHASWGALRAALSRAAEHSDDPAARAKWLIEISNLDLVRFEDLRAAEASIARALETRPKDPALLLQRAKIQVAGGQLTGLPALIAEAEAAGARNIPGDLQLVRGDALFDRWRPHGCAGGLRSGDRRSGELREGLRPARRPRRYPAQKGGGLGACTRVGHRQRA